MRYILILMVLFVWTVSAEAKVRTETVEYRHGDKAFEGFLAYDDAKKGPIPGVVVVHEWWGINDYIRGRAVKLAELGYVAFAIDMYGKGIRPTNSKDAQAQSSALGKNRQLLRERAKAGLEILRNNKLADKSRIAAIGYCFGGMTVLELARGGADISGIVSFHGTLDTPDISDAKNIKGKVLVLTGADDPVVPPDKVLEFENEMKKAGVDWQVDIYGGAMHSFTNPQSNNPENGVLYNERAARRSWEAMKLFLNEVFGKG
ncbi:MAG: dienelactone hydrolase family protein [Deltaproteobacteria bacterium]|nr:dienelactone hydrolase family protein [Deltaproteobacteria bacterium]